VSIAYRDPRVHLTLLGEAGTPHRVRAEVDKTWATARRR